MTSGDRLLLFSNIGGTAPSSDVDFSLFRPLSFDFFEHFFINLEEPTGSSFSDTSDSDSSGAKFIKT